MLLVLEHEYLQSKDESSICGTLCISMFADNSCLRLVAPLGDSSNAGSRHFSLHKVHRISHLVCFWCQELPSALVGEWLLVITMDEMMGKYLYFFIRNKYRVFQF